MQSKARTVAAYIGDAVASVTPEKYIAAYTKSRGLGAKAGKARAARKKARA